MNNTKGIQIAHNKTFNEYEGHQDAVERECGVRCSIVVMRDHISVRTKTFTDYILAKAVLLKRTNLPVTRDIE